MLETILVEFFVVLFDINLLLRFRMSLLAMLYWSYYRYLSKEMLANSVTRMGNLLHFG